MSVNHIKWMSFAILQAVAQFTSTEENQSIFAFKNAWKGPISQGGAL